MEAVPRIWRDWTIDAIWFTGGPLKTNVPKKYQKFDEKACYTVENSQKTGVYNMLFDLIQKFGWKKRGVLHAFRFNTLLNPRRITCFSI